MKYFRLAWMLLMLGGGILVCLPSCSDKDNGMEQPKDPDDPQDPDDPDDPDDPNDDTPSYKMTVGELMYYGHDSDYSKDGGAVYFLYLKDANPINVCSICFYVNVPKQKAGSFTLPEGKYTGTNTWEIGTFNTKDTEKYKSNWNLINPKWTQYVVGSGEFEVSIKDSYYIITGKVRGGHIKDDDTIDGDETGAKFTFTGKLPCTDYSADYEDPNDPDTPDDPDPEVPKVTMTTGSLYRYNDNVYFLQLKDANPTNLYDATFYLKLPASETPQLVSGDYAGATTAAEMTIDITKSFWNFTDKANLNDKIKNRLKEGTKITVVNNGNHNYTITGTLEGTSDKTNKATALEISFTGTLPFEDYADPEPVEPVVPEVTMTTGNLDYYDGNVYTLTLKDANPTDTYEATFSFKLPASDTPQLVSGDYPVSTTGGEMTFDAAKSSWTFIDTANLNDRVKNTIKEGTLTVVNNGSHNYTVTGTLKGTSDTGQETAIKIDFTGTVPFNDYSTPPTPEAPEATMTIADMYYNGDNVFYLNLKDGKSGSQTYDATFYITLTPPSPLGLASGDYTASTTGGEMTYNTTNSKSFWNYIDRSSGYADTFKNGITEGTLTVVNNGSDNYTSTGTLKGLDEYQKETSLKISFTGKIPCEDYSY